MHFVAGVCQAQWSLLERMSLSDDVGYLPFVYVVLFHFVATDRKTVVPGLMLLFAIHMMETKCRYSHYWVLVGNKGIYAIGNIQGIYSLIPY